MLVKYDPRNMERVYARPRGNPLANFLSSLGFPPISLWELEEERRGLKDKGRGR